MIQNELKAQIEARFDVGKIEEISRLEGGYWNQVFKLETEKGNFVLRICNPRTKAESVGFQHKLMRFLHERITEVPRPVAGRDGETFFVYENRVISLLTFMPGEMASRKNTSHQIAAAAMLGRLHRTALDYPENLGISNYEPLAAFD